VRFEVQKYELSGFIEKIITITLIQVKDTAY